MFAVTAPPLVGCVSLGLPMGLLPLSLISMNLFTQFSLFLIKFSYHLSLPLLITVVRDLTATSFINYSLVFLSFMEIPHIYLVICKIPCAIHIVYHVHVL